MGSVRGRAMVDWLRHRCNFVVRGDFDSEKFWTARYARFQCSLYFTLTTLIVEHPELPENTDMGRRKRRKTLALALALARKRGAFREFTAPRTLFGRERERERES